MASNTGFFGRLGMAANAFITTFRSANPQVALSGDSQQARAGRYEYLQAWYDGTVFLDASMASYLKTRYRLYRHTRLLWNPIPNIINFWAGIQYPGNLSGDGLPFEGNKPTAVPFNEDIKPELAKAIAQVFLWGNFQSTKSVWPRYGALTGNSLMWIRDDALARKVYLEVEKPERVAAVTLNPQGDVLFAAIEYKTRDSDASGAVEYTYRREVDRQQIRTYRDGKLWSYNEVPHTVDHPYPFCPAVWVSHQATGSIFGDGAIKSWWGTLGALAEINSLQSRLADTTTKFAEPLTGVETNGSIEPLFSRSKRGATAELTEGDMDRESIPMLKVPPGTKFHTVTPTLNLGDTRLYLIDQKLDWKGHYPEYDLYPQLRSMSQVTGPAAEILLGDVTTPVREVRANYDRQLIKACQMAVTMASIRAASDWGELDASRAQFKAFDLGSFERGELAFEIQDRPLIPDAPLSEAEMVDIASKKRKNLDVPKEQIWDELGYTEEQIGKWTADAAANAPTIDDAFKQLETVQAATNRLAGRMTQEALTDG